MGIDKTKAVLENLFELAADAIVVAKGGVGLGSFKKILEIIGDVKGLLENAPGAWPELQELDANEVGQLGSAAYSGVLKVISAVKA